MVAIKISLTSQTAMEAKSPTATNPVKIDLPKALGGGGGDMSPTDLVAAALASCMLTTMGLVARKMGINLEGASAEVTKTMVLEPEMKFTGFHVTIHLPMVVEEAQQKKLEAAALQCPIHKALRDEIRKETLFNWGP